MQHVENVMKKQQKLLSTNFKVAALPQADTSTNTGDSFLKHLQNCFRPMAVKHSGI